jgi:adenylate cyclase class 2
MNRETEIKLKIDDLKAFERGLKKLGAQMVSGLDRVHEENTIFDTPEGGLAKHGQLLRIRTETAGAKVKKSKKRFIVTFKRPTQQRDGSAKKSQAISHYKIREEFELDIADSSMMTKVFEGLGMRGWFRYEKYRTTYRLPAKQTWAKGLLIEVDETPVGIYVELEGPTEAIDRAATKLGFSKKDYILKNYLALYVEQCRRKGEEPKDMLFTEAKSSRK